VTAYDAKAILEDVATVDAALDFAPIANAVTVNVETLRRMRDLAERVAKAPVGKAYTPGELHFNKDEIQLTGVVPMFDVRSTKARGRTFALVNLEQKP
jgi:hypothetical protein